CGEPSQTLEHVMTTCPKFRLSCYTDHLFVAVKQSVCFNYTGWCYNKQWEEARIKLEKVEKCNQQVKQ
uniref:Uncharacterized protein n=1 Tax=Astyanax mexicanus TaxID=7994 RepID=A0A8B9RHJ8_ASTMX